MSDSYVIGVDVGGTNTDAVLMKAKDVVAWHKSPTTADVSNGVLTAIKEVLRKADLPSSAVSIVKIGTTQFLNASLERDGRKMDKVAVLRLCGPYTQSVVPFLSFPNSLRRIIEGHYAYINGGTHVNGKDIDPLSLDQLKEEAGILRTKEVRSVVLVGVNSPSFPVQEDEAAKFLSEELGSSFDISCSHHLGNAGFLERENTAILNASIRRFARHVIHGLGDSISGTLPQAKIFMTLNDGTISPARYTAQYPLKCFASGPTNSARGAAYIAKEFLSQQGQDNADNGADLLVIDVGGTTTDVCSLLSNGYPKHSAAFVKISGVKTNLSMPQIHNIALGGGSIIRAHVAGIAVGPESVAAGESTMSLAAGGATFTASDLVKLGPDRLGELGISSDVVARSKDKIKNIIEAAVEFAKTKPIDAEVILVGGGSFILPETEKLKGIHKITRPEYYQVANAIGAAIAKVSGRVDRLVIPREQSFESAVEDGKQEAIQLCCDSGGLREAAEIVDLEIVPETYSFNGAFRLLVRAVSDFDNTLVDVAANDKKILSSEAIEKNWPLLERDQRNVADLPEDVNPSPVDISAYSPHIENDLWTVSKIDVDLLMDGTGVLGAGCMGEATNYLLALKEAIRCGQKVQIVPLSVIKEDDVICPTCWIGSPTAFFERIPGNVEMQEAVYANLSQVGKSDFTHTIAPEIGGPNALEALLFAATVGKVAVDADLMGRAFPRAYMTIPGIHGKSIAPVALCDGNGAIVLLKQTKDDYQAEDILRSATDHVGGIAALGLRPFGVNETHLFAHNSYSLAWSIGRSMRLARQEKGDVAMAVVAACQGQLLFRGKVNLVSRLVQSSFTRGTCTILPDSDGISTSTESWLELVFENEILAAVLKSPDSSTCLAATPDLMAIIDSTSGQVIGITELRYGLRVAIIALRAPDIWYSAEGMRRAGPAAFGTYIINPETSAYSNITIREA